VILLNKEQWKKRLYSILSLDSHPGHIAAGFAVGVFISFTPFFGLHTPLAIAAAFIFRLNKVTCITGAWVNTPITVIPILGIGYKLGRFLRGRSVNELTLPGGFTAENLEHFGKSLLTGSSVHAKSLILGTSILGFFAAVIAYFLCYYLVVKFRARDAAQAELDKQMAEVGEELE
jgi:uncharacterized protein